MNMRVFTLILALLLAGCGGLSFLSSRAPKPAPQSIEDLQRTTVQLRLTYKACSDKAPRPVITTSGSAVAIHRDEVGALLLTAHHVIGDIREERPRYAGLYSDPTYEIRSDDVLSDRARLTVTATWEERDLATVLLKAPNKLRAAEIATSKPQLLAPMVLTGSPWGIFPPRMMVGYAGPYRVVHGQKFREIISPTQPGMSGGGCFRLRDRKLVGITSRAMRSPHGQFLFGYCVTLDDIQRFITATEL